MANGFTAQQVVRLRKLLQGKGISAEDCDAISDYLVGDADLPENMEVRGAKVMSAMDEAIDRTRHPAHYDAFGNPRPRASRLPNDRHGASYVEAFPGALKIKSLG